MARIQCGELRVLTMGLLHALCTLISTRPPWSWVRRGVLNLSHFHMISYIDSWWKNNKCSGNSWMCSPSLGPALQYQTSHVMRSCPSVLGCQCDEGAKGRYKGPKGFCRISCADAIRPWLREIHHFLEGVVMRHSVKPIHNRMHYFKSWKVWFYNIIHHYSLNILFQFRSW